LAPGEFPGDPALVVAGVLNVGSFVSDARNARGGSLLLIGAASSF
jgi:hypothetical protein